MRIFTVIGLSIALTACQAVSLPITPKKSQTSDEDAKALICEWGKAAGLPHTNLQSRALILGNENINQSTRDAYSADLRRVVGTSMVFECLCGDEARKAVLQCDAPTNLTGEISQ